MSIFNFASLIPQINPSMPSVNHSSPLMPSTFSLSHIFTTLLKCFSLQLLV